MTNRKDIDLDTLLDEQGDEVRKNRDTASFGPSDSSDSGSDVIGLESADSTSDRNRTGERADMEGDVLPDADLGADHIVDAQDAGLGGGLDQAEEALLGVTDEEIEAAVRKRLGLEPR